MSKSAYAFTDFSSADQSHKEKKKMSLRKCVTSGMGQETAR